MAEQDSYEGIRSVGWLLHRRADEHDVPCTALYLGQDSIQEGLELERRWFRVDGDVQGLSAARDLPREGRHLEMVGTPDAQSNMRRKAIRIGTPPLGRAGGLRARHVPATSRSARSQIPSHCDHWPE